MTAATKARGRSCVRRHTYDMDSEKAQGPGPARCDGTLESSRLIVAALIKTAETIQETTANATRYGQGAISRVACKALRVLFSDEHGYDHYSGTNDLAGSQIAERGGFSKRQWQRVKPTLAKLGFLSFVHRSVKSGLADLPGVDRDIQISDVFSFRPERLIPWIRDIYESTLATLKRQRDARLTRNGEQPRRTPLVKRERPQRRIPALLNPVGWARALAAEAKAKAAPAANYAAEEARALAFATQLALKARQG